jgi:hypothetical protein
MAAAGCIRISIGVETLEGEAAARLPLVKQSPAVSFEKAATWCRKHRIELNCFVIVGLPGTTLAGTQQTIELIAQAGARARPTLYTPYHRMHGTMTEREVSAFNRHLFVESGESTGRTREESLALLSFIFGNDGYITPATQQIPKAAHRSINSQA